MTGRAFWEDVLAILLAVVLADLISTYVVPHVLGPAPTADPATQRRTM